MPHDAADLEALQQTLPLYGAVLRAQAMFEKQMCAYLTDQFAVRRALFERGGFEFAEALPKARSWSNYWANWCYASFPLKKLGPLPGAADAKLVLYAGWRSSPETDAQALPFAYLEVDYSEVDDRGAWKKLMGKVREGLPASLQVECSIQTLGLMRPGSDEATYRRTLDELSGDFEHLTVELTKAVKKVLCKAGC